MVGTIVLMGDGFLRLYRRRRRARCNGGGGAGDHLPHAVVLAILAPILAKLIQLAVSRQRDIWPTQAAPR